MPQCISGNWKAKDIPYGKGSRHGDLLDCSFRTRRRATKINEGERGRCSLMVYMMDKHHRAVEDRHEKVMNRIRKTLEEREAYKQVLESYKADNFKTMEWGFKKRQMRTPSSFQRYKLETRVYNCGFSVDTLYPEVTQLMEINKPEHRKRVFHEKMLESSRKRSDFLIDRRITDQGVRQERQKTTDAIESDSLGRLRKEMDLKLRMHTSI